MASGCSTRSRLTSTESPKITGCKARTDLPYLVKDAGMSILLSEQNMRSALKLIDSAYMIDNGLIRFSGTIAELEANERVEKRCLMA